MLILVYDNTYLWREVVRMDSLTDDKNKTKEEENEAREKSDEASGKTTAQQNPHNEPGARLELDQTQQAGKTNTQDISTKNMKPETEQLIEEQEKIKDSGSSKSCHGIPKRYILLILVFLGFVNIYGLRINLNVALVAMVNNRTYTRNGIIVKEPAEFHWNSRTQGKR